MLARNKVRHGSTENILNIKSIETKPKEIIEIQICFREFKKPLTYEYLQRLFRLLLQLKIFCVNLTLPYAIDKFRSAFFY
jgi:hypothetical protein